MTSTRNASRQLIWPGTASVLCRLVALVVVSFALALSARAARPQSDSADPPRHSFVLSYVVKVKPPANSHTVRAWIPLPASDDVQTISELQLQAPAGIHVQQYSEAGSDYAYFTADPDRARAPFEVRLTFRVTRYERRLDVTPATNPQGPLPDDVAQFLQADRWGLLDDGIAAVAREQTSGISDPLQKARKIFEYVTTAAPERDAVADGACDSPGKGCTGFNSLFISLARAAGIPARLEIGFSLPDGQREGTISGYHCWAEFYVNDAGWIPLDASRARLEPAKRDDFFGAIDARRVTISNGRSDVPFAPGLTAGALNYLIDPYVEVNGKPCSHYSANFFFQEGDFAGPLTSGRAMDARNYSRAQAVDTFRNIANPS